MLQEYRSENQPAPVDILKLRNRVDILKRGLKLRCVVRGGIGSEIDIGNPRLVIGIKRELRQLIDNGKLLVYVRDKAVGNAIIADTQL